LKSQKPETLQKNPRKIKDGKERSMIYIKGKTELPEGVEERLLEELEKYRLVQTRITCWERLDDDREGEDEEEFVYSLTDENDAPYGRTIIIEISDDDYSFLGITLLHKSTTSWDAGLNKEETHMMCSLYVDGRRTGNYESTSTYESPNNYDKVETSYSLRRI
jgi:hypothetical protein